MNTKIVEGLVDAIDTFALALDKLKKALVCCYEEKPESHKVELVTKQVLSDEHPKRKREPKPKSPVEKVKKPVMVKCIHCGKEFVKSKRRKFCSNECKATYYSQLYEQKRKSATPIYEYTCSICGKKFSSKKANLVNYSCSTKCNNIMMLYKRFAERHPGVTLQEYLASRKEGEHVTVTKVRATKRACLFCGREYIPTTEEQKYCSKACKFEAHEKDKAERLAASNEEIPEVKPSVPEVVSKPTKDDPRTFELRECPICKMKFEAAKGTNVRYCGKCLSHFGYEECKLIEEEEKLKQETESSKTKFKVCSRCGAYFTDLTATKNQLFCERCKKFILHKQRK